MKKGEKPSMYIHQGRNRENNKGLVSAQLQGVEWLVSRLHGVKCKHPELENCIECPCRNDCQGE